MSKFVWQWSLQVVLVLVGFGIDLIPEVKTWAYSIALWIAAFIWLIVTVILWAKSRRKISAVQQPQKRDGVLVKAETILIQIHKRMLELKDKAARQYYLKHSFKEFLGLLNALMGKNTGLEDIRKNLRGKKLSKNREKKRLQIDNLLDQVKPTLSTDWSLDALVKFVNKFNRLAQSPDKRYEGLDILRDKDKRWAKLFGELQNLKTEFNDVLLNKMIDDYIDWSYGCSSLSLLSDLIRYIAVDNLPTELLESDAYNPSIKIENLMTQLRSEITNRIKELLSINLSIQKGDFSFEFNDHSITTKDGRLILGVSYFTTNRITIETLQLDYNGKRFRPSDWSPIEIKHIHTKNYTFDLNALKATADEASQEAVLIAKVEGVEYRSHPFNIYKLF